MLSACILIFNGLNVKHHKHILKKTILMRAGKGHKGYLWRVRCGHLQAGREAVVVVWQKTLRRNGLSLKAGMKSSDIRLSFKGHHGVAQAQMVWWGEGLCTRCVVVTFTVGVDDHMTTPCFPKPLVTVCTERRTTPHDSVCTSDLT